MSDQLKKTLDHFLGLSEEQPTSLEKEQLRRLRTMRDTGIERHGRTPAWNEIEKRLAAKKVTVSAKNSTKKKITWLAPLVAAAAIALVIIFIPGEKAVTYDIIEVVGEARLNGQRLKASDALPEKEVVSTTAESMLYFHPARGAMASLAGASKFSIEESVMKLQAGVLVARSGGTVMHASYKNTRISGSDFYLLGRGDSLIVYSCSQVIIDDGKARRSTSLHTRGSLNTTGDVEADARNALKLLSAKMGLNSPCKEKKTERPILAKEKSSSRKGSLPVHRLSFFKGSVMILRNNKWSPGKLGQGFKDGIEIKTGPGSTALLNLAEGSSLKLRQNSQVALTINEATKKNQVQLKAGSMFVDLQKNDYSHSIVTSEARGSSSTGQFFVAYGQENKEAVWLCANRGEIKLVAETNQRYVKALYGVAIVDGSINKPEKLEWTKSLNWNMRPSKGTVIDNTRVKENYQDLLDQDYD